MAPDDRPPDDSPPDDEPLVFPFDDDFVKAARKHEPSGIERAQAAARARAARQRLEREQEEQRWARALFDYDEDDAAAAVRRSPRWRAWVAGVLALGMAGAILWTAWPRRSLAPPVWESGPRAVGPVRPENRPTPQPAPSPVPLGTPAPVSGGSGNYVFVARQPGTADPVAYDPCRPIKVVVNPRAAPSESDDLVIDALDEVSRVTGLRFEVEGTTDEAPVHQRPPFQPDRYGDRWAPVLIAWSDAQEFPALAGPVAGIGGSSWLGGDPAIPEVYVSGAVVLDGPQLDDLLDGDDGRDHARAVLLHELGHVVGLDHVDDADQLMHRSNQAGRDDFQEGDRVGLARLGRGACLPLL